MRTIAHVYDSYSEASRVVTALEAAGIAQDDISLISGDKTAGRGTATGATSGDPEQGAETGAGTGATIGTVVGGGAGLLAGIGSLAIPGVGPLVAAGWLVATLTGAGVGAAAGGLVGSLTGAGLSEADAQAHSEGVSRGGTLVTVRADDAQADRVEQIMKGGTAGGMGGRTGLPGDMATRTAGTGVGTAGASTPHMAGPDETIKVVREDLTVGKRQVEHGGVRVTSHVVETPVEEQVTLHDETVRLERRPVSEGGTVPADAFQERVIEVQAMSEEAVISKDARVVEEIAIRKTVEDRVETVRDTVRETKVEIEDDATKDRSGTMTDKPGIPPRR